jgi:membrane protease subunit HflC
MKKFLFFILVCFFCFFGYTSLFVVNEVENAIVLQLGRLKIDNTTKLPVVYQPGIHFKIPFIEIVNKYDVRLGLFSIQSSRITTIEKKDVLVDFYVIWQIQDLVLFYTRTSGNILKTEELLKQKVIAALKAEFGKCTVKEVVYGERLEVMDRLKRLADENIRDMGITIVDIRAKRIDLPDEVRNSVYVRMETERERVACEVRSTGRANATKIRSYAEKERRIILARANRASKEIKARGEAYAMHLYADAYSTDVEFYFFYRSLQAYKKIFRSSNDLLLLKPDGDFFRYFKKIK